MVIELVNESKKVGLEIDINKTKYMQNASKKGESKIVIEGKELEEVDEYAYLEAFQNRTGEEEVKEREKRA